MIDPFYTPTPLAAQLADNVDVDHVNRIADFCVGDGELIRAARNKYPDAICYGADICNDVIANLKEKHPDWNLAVCDFEDDESVNRVDFIKDQLFDLIMMNPPFTCKGSIVETIEFEGQIFKVSTAMKFVMRALEYLSAEGGLYAILPISCVYSDKDKKAWDYLRQRHYACVLEEPERVYFSKKCSPCIVLVYIGNRNIRRTYQNNMNPFLDLPIEDVVRGAIRMQGLKVSNSKNAKRLIHTTNMQNGKLVNVNKILTSYNTVSGYGVVIPRVCNPNRSKIVVLDNQKGYVLSDCVALLKTRTLEEAIMVKERILEQWSAFEQLYKGTGARYTTVQRLKTAFGVADVNKLQNNGLHEIKG